MKQVLFLTLGVLWLVSCSDNRKSEQNIATTKAMFDAFNKHDWEKMASYYSTNAMFLDPSYGPEYVTKSRIELATKYAEIEKMFPDVHDEIIGLYPSGDKVAIEFVSTGSVSDSTKFKLPIITVLTFQDGLIIKDATYYDLENP